MADLSIQHCDGEKETEFEFCSVKQNTVEEFEFDCSRCGKKVNLMSSIPAVKTTTRPTSAGRNFAGCSFIPCQWAIFQRLPQNSRDSRSGSRQFHSVDPYGFDIVEWIVPFVKRIADWSVQKARTEAV